METAVPPCSTRPGSAVPAANFVPALWRFPALHFLSTRVWAEVRRPDPQWTPSNFYFGEPGGTRTHDPKIKSLVLYHLSYGLPAALKRQAATRPTAARRRQLLHVGRDPHVHDPVRVRHRAAAAAAALDLVDELHALHHLAPDRVLAVQDAAPART